MAAPRVKFPIGATVTAVCCVAILFGLGTWQMKRLDWKNGIIERLNASYEASAKADTLDGRELGVIAADDNPMAYGSVQVRLLREQSILLGPKIEDGRNGFHLLIPAITDNGRTLIINAGWVNDLWQDNIEDRLSVLPADVIVRGILHKPDWSSFASKNSPSNNMWFRADITQIAQVKNLKDPYPFILYADAVTPDLYEVKLHEERWLPRNKHLQYALFWYALGLVMMGVYGFYVFGLYKKPENTSEA